jgi:sulfur carrier protein
LCFSALRGFFRARLAPAASPGYEVDLRKRREAAAAKRARCEAFPCSYTGSVITVTVNGEKRDLSDGTTLRALIAEFKLTPDKVAIELNRRLVRSEKYDTPLNAGDTVEIVTFVGGG